MLVYDKKNRNNLIALTVAWSTSAFTFYLVEFYMKLVPFSNMYILIILIGFSDVNSALLFFYMIKNYGNYSKRV